MKYINRAWGIQLWSFAVYPVGFSPLAVTVHGTAKKRLHECGRVAYLVLENQLWVLPAYTCSIIFTCNAPRELLTGGYSSLRTTGLLGQALSITLHCQFQWIADFNSSGKLQVLRRFVAWVIPLGHWFLSIAMRPLFSASPNDESEKPWHSERKNVTMTLLSGVRKMTGQWSTSITLEMEHYKKPSVIAMTIYHHWRLVIRLFLKNPNPQEQKSFQRKKDDNPLQLRSAAGLGHEGARLPMSRATASVVKGSSSLYYLDLFGRGSFRAAKLERSPTAGEDNAPCQHTFLRCSALTKGIRCFDL